MTRMITDFKKVTSIILTMVIIVGCLFVPAMSAFAAPVATVTEDEEFVIDFSSSITHNGADENKAEFDNSDPQLGYVGYGGTVIDVEGNKVLDMVNMNANNQEIFGGYRLNKYNSETGKYEVYELEPSSDYVIKFKIRVMSGTTSVATTIAGSTSYISLGYGSKYASWYPGNCVVLMDNVIAQIVTSPLDSEEFILTTNGGDKNCEYSEEWIDYSYTFTTPEDLGTGDKALTIYPYKFHGFQAQIDDISVTKVSSNKGIVVLKDEYSSFSDVLVGKVGDSIVLPDISGRATATDDEFQGWYLDEARTVSAENAKFTAGTTEIYSKWNAPVTVTFINTLTSQETKVTGKPGDALTFPANPADGENKYFTGWYTTTAYTEEFTSSVFPAGNKSIYARFEEQEPGIKEDFEEYTKDQPVPSNKLYFGLAMKKQSQVTYGNSDYAIKFVWDKNRVVDANDPSSYDAVTRYFSSDNLFSLGTGLKDDSYYTLTFKYRVEKADSDFCFYVATGASDNHWANSYEVFFDNINGKKVQKGEWLTYTTLFKANYVTGFDTIFLGILLTSNENMEVYFDDVEITPIKKPNEGAIILDPATGEKPTYIKGKMGTNASIPTPTHPSGAPFVGWYKDADYKVENDVTKFGKDFVELYAKWGFNAISFKNYPYNSKPGNNFGSTMAIVNESGVGRLDDYALRFQFDGDSFHSYDSEGKIVYMNSRAGSSNHLATIGKVEKGKIYRVSFYYRTSENCQTDYSIRLLLANEHNIWIDPDYKEIDGTRIEVKAQDGTEWVRYETAFLAEPNVDSGRTLYILFNSADKTLDAYVEAFVDDVEVAEIEKPYVFFNTLGNGLSKVVSGKEGDTIELPEPPEVFGVEFEGWYSDATFKYPFSLTTFGKNTALTVYAKFRPASKMVYDFEEYNFVTNTAAGYINLGNSERIESTTAHSGNYVMRFDLTKSELANATFCVIGRGSDPFMLEDDVQYIVELKYRVIKHSKQSNLGIRLALAQGHNFWASWVDPFPAQLVSKDDKVGKWYTKTFAVDCSTALNEYGKALYIDLDGGRDGIYEFDTVTVYTAPKGYGAIAVHNAANHPDIPAYVIGRIGSSYYNSIPKNPTMSGKYFKGYYTINAAKSYELETKDTMVFGKTVKNVIARFINTKVVQDFEGVFKDQVSLNMAYSIHDFDYELYDKNKEGNSADNVKSGRYSLRRKGTSMYFENSILLTQDLFLCEGERYTVTMKVKIGEHLHTDGAIKIANGYSYRYPWSTLPDYYSLAAIKDIADGQWHTLSFTFDSALEYCSIQTPGYCEVFIDDVVFTLANGAPLSTSVTGYTEYVQVRRDKDGNIIETTEEAIDVMSIIDPNLKKALFGTNNTLVIVIIAVAIVLIAAALVTVIILKKKRKNKV